MNAYTIIADRVLQSLPEGIDERRAVLAALVDVLPRTSERRDHVVLSLNTLNSHIQLQTEFRSILASGVSGVIGRPSRKTA